MNAKEFRSFVWLLVSAAVVFAGCAPAIQIPADLTQVPATTRPASTARGIEAWQDEWERVKAAAQKEGKVVVASGISPGTRTAVNEAFQAKYGVNVEFIAGQAAQLAPKLLAEVRAGIYSVDAVIGGVGAIDSALAPAGVLEPLDNVLLLPEVIDKNAWWGGNLLWVDQNHLHVSFLAFPNYNIIINTDLVAGQEIKSYRDLLKPKLKERIAYFDPTVPGGGRNLFITLGDSVMDKEYLRQLGNQGLIISRDRRLLTEWVARGKYSIGMGISVDEVMVMVRAGAPIAFVKASEGTYMTGGMGGLALVKTPPHPNARKLLANWLLSKEGQTVFSRAFGAQSARNDVPVDFLDSIMIREPGVKYVSTINAQWEEKAEQYVKIAREMWGHLMK